MKCRLLNYFLFVLLLLVGCATPRTKFSDPVMRIMLDPTSVNRTDYSSIVKSLTQSGKWVVVDRAKGFEAAMKEQERQHRDEEERMEPRQRWAHWGKMYGIRGVIVGHTECQQKTTFFPASVYLFCRQFLSLADANTAEIICAVEQETDGPSSRQHTFPLRPGWDEAVAKLNESFPTHFEDNKNHPRLEKYKDESAQLAEDQRKKTDEKREREVAEDRQQVQENHQRKLELIKARNEGKFKEDSEQED